MDFEEYLTSKKIDSPAFQTAEPLRWTEWKSLFEQMSPASFTSQKLYLINPTRRKYPLKVVTASTEQKADAPGTAPAKSSRPVFKPKIN